MAGRNKTAEPPAEMVGRELTIERVFDAAVTDVWSALTEETSIRKWSFDVSGFKPVPGYEFRIVKEKDGKIFDHRCVVKEAVPMKKLSFSWRYEGYEGDSLVTYELTAMGTQTLLKLTHSGLETFPQDADLARKNFEAGWNSIVGGSLRNFVENNGADADTSDREIVTTRVFDAPRELVWDAMTTPEHVEKWWGPRGFSTTTEIFDVRVGGVWKHTMHGPDGVNYPNYAIFKEVVRPERIVYSHGGNKEDGPSVRFIATWTFEEVEKRRTRVTIHGVFPTAEARNFAAKEFGAVEGANQTLERLGEFLASL